MRQRRAFTLVELLVVVAIIALLLSILLPSLEAAREQARTVVCGTHLHDISNGGSIYANQFNGWLPGSPGTSGAALFEVNAYYGNVNSYDWQDKTYVATSAWDWASPIAQYGLGWKDMPKDRRERMELIREGLFRCPSNNFLSVPYPPAQGSTWPVTTLQSYGSIRGMMYFPFSTADEGIAMPNWPIRTPTNHRPRLGQLENPAAKVFLGEGARFNVVDTGDADHDYDVSYAAGYGGAFSTDGASSGFSRGYINPIQINPFLHDRRFDRKSYRHLVRTEPGMNGLFFDGHAEAMTKKDAILNIDYWWPTSTALETDGTVVLELAGPGAYSAKPRASDEAIKRGALQGDPWGLPGQEVIVLN